jgi:exopolysaccharide biosynthesis polyprenyl glycosylphosphotransferase
MSIAQEQHGTPQEARSRRFHRSVRGVVRIARQSEGLVEGATRPATAFREGLYRRTLALADAAVAGIVVLGLLPLLSAHVLLASVLAAIPAIVLVNKLCGLYERDELVLKKTTLDEAPRLLQMAAVFTLLLWLFHDGLTAVVLSAGDVIVIWGATFILLVGLRGLARWVVRRVAPPERCLVVGPAESIALIRHKLQAGRINAGVVASVAVDDDGTTLVALGELIVRHDVHRVVIAPAAQQGGETLDLIRTAKHAGVRVSVLPRLLEVVGSSVEFDQLDGLTMLGVRRFGLSRSSYALKRAFDLAGSGLALVVSTPAMLAIALAIRLESGGSAFFRQTRVGKDGRRFKMLKFRSMVWDAEARKETLRPFNEAQGLFKIAEDPRVTRVGRFLRRTSLDELPQLFNVWRGEMSLVGPRPLVVDEDALVHGLDRHRLHLTPGMTGHWQILGSARLPMQEMVGIDYLYVANWSLWTDVKILLRTIPYVLASRSM